MTRLLPKASAFGAVAFFLMQVFWIQPALAWKVTAVVPKQGSTVVLPGYAVAKFPDGTFPKSTSVMLYGTRDQNLKKLFGDLSPIYNAPIPKYFIKINTGMTVPQKYVDVIMDIPADLAAKKPADYSFAAYVAYESGGLETYYDFEPVPTVIDVGKKKVSFTVAIPAFSNVIRPDKTYEAVVAVSLIPTTEPSGASAPTLKRTGKSGASEIAPALKSPSLTSAQFAALLRSMLRAPAAAPKECEGSSLGEPLKDAELSKLPGTEFCDQKEKCPRKRDHKGVDYQATPGQDVFAAADGKIIISKLQTNKAGTVIGFGNYIAILHTGDKAVTLYGHLKDREFKVGDTVKKGDLIGHADNTGSSQGNHLHFEYINQVLRTKTGVDVIGSSRIDPAPCVGTTVAGDITVSDNGSLADDAFTLRLDGNVICATTIGASNNCAIGGLAPGQKTLSITCDVAPDDVGTYQITLAGGLTFAGGGTGVSDVLPQGGSRPYQIIVPPPAQ